MAFQFPWTNLHELNLDWFLSKFKQFTNNFLETTATAESVPYNAQPSVTVTGGELDDDTDIVNPFNFHFKIPAGMGILSLTITYNVTDNDTQPASGWTTTKPAVNPGQYLWIRQTIILQNGVGQSYTYFVYYPVDGTTPTITIDDFPTEDSPNAVSSGGVWSDVNDLKNLTSANFAWVETTNTATRAYTKGDYITVNGRLCEVTANIAQGATLTENTNYKVLSGNGGYGDVIAKLVANGFNVYTYNVTTFNAADYRQALIDNINDIEARKPCIVFPRADRRVMFIGLKYNNNLSIFILLSPDSTQWVRCDSGMWKYTNVAINTNH